MTQLSDQGDRDMRAQLASDPRRPAFHFLPPANWMNDPNGPIFYQGWYHLFYQYNPYGDVWGHCHWGHARSRDLMHWEHLPVALAPLHAAGEEHCFSGCAALDEEGRPIILYTSVPFPDAGGEQRYAQWAAVGDDDLLTWRRHPANPILDLDTYGGPALETDWRDPFLFREEGRTFLVLGANTADRANVLLFEALDGSLIHWRYCGVLFSRPRTQARLLECPNFVKVGRRWVLLYSPFGPIEYAVGTFDLATLSFHPEREGVLDPGCSEAPNFYASNILFDELGRCILLGWVRGFASGRGWNGCLAIPRVLTVGDDGTPRQAFLPALQQLRRTALAAIARHDHNGSWGIEGIVPPRLEAQIVVTCPDTGAFAVRFVSADDGSPAAQIRFTGAVLSVQDTEVPLALAPGESLNLHIVLDGSVLEVLAGDGRVAVTRVLPAVPELRMELAASGGQVRVDHLALWELAPIVFNGSVEP